MSKNDPDQEKPVEESSNQTLADKVEALQEPVKKTRIVLNRLDDEIVINGALKNK